MKEKAVSGLKTRTMSVFSFLFILLVALVIRMAIALVFGGDPIAGVMNYRPFVIACNVGPAVLAMLALDYGCLLLVFILFYRSWPGQAALKGIMFGASFGFLWFYGMLEAAFALNTSLVDEFLFGLGEMPAIIMMGFLAGKAFSAKKSLVTRKDDRVINDSAEKPLVSAAAIALFLGVGRFFSYAVVKVEPAWQSVPYALWTMGFAIVVAAIYLVIGRKLPGTGIRKALLFGFPVFGLNWMLFNLFVPYLFVVPVREIFHYFVVRVILDCVYVTGGIWTASIITCKK